MLQMRYIKKLNAQELGYRRGILRTGGYFYISKKAAATFFGVLSKQINNDMRILELHGKDESFEVAEISYVYHNDSFNTEGGTRDEYRIYLNRQIQFHSLHFKPNEIVVFSKMDNKLYFEHIKPNSLDYSYYESLLSQYGSRGNHALIEF